MPIYNFKLKEGGQAVAGYGNGTADQHTSFSVAYNICLAAQVTGLESDYALVWAMGHGSNEGTTTGTFVDWINKICG